MEARVGKFIDQYINNLADCQLYPNGIWFFGWISEDISSCKSTEQLLNVYAHDEIINGEAWHIIEIPTWKLKLAMEELYQELTPRNIMQVLNTCKGIALTQIRCPECGQRLKMLHRENWGWHIFCPVHGHILKSENGNLHRYQIAEVEEFWNWREQQEK